MNILPKLKNFTFVLFAFAIPFSVALTNILIVLFAFLWIIEGRFIEKINKIKSTYWIGSLILIAALYLIGLLNGDFHADSIYVIKRAFLLLFFIPIYTSDISLDNCNRAIHVFLVTNFLLLLLLFQLILNSYNHFFLTLQFQHS